MYHDTISELEVTVRQSSGGEMRVCMLTSSYPRSPADGAGAYVGALARRLSDMGHTVHVVAPYDPLVAETDEGGVIVHRFKYVPFESLNIAGHGRSLQADVRMRPLVPLLMPSYVASALNVALRIHRRERFDIVHGHWVVPGGVIAAIAGRIADTPLVITLHGSDVYLTRRNRLWAAFARYAYGQASLVTAVSDDLRLRAVQKGLPPDKSCVVSCGVDTARYGIGDGSRMRATLGIPQDSPVIGALGRMVHKKGFDCLISAMDRILATRDDVYCVIGGEGALHAQLVAQVARLGHAGRILLPGHIGWAETPDFYGMCDLIAVPSVVDARGNVDGLPLVLLEAMASSRPVVASRVSGIPEVVEDGATGLLVPPGDPKSLASALVSLLSNNQLAACLGKNARASMIAKFDWSIIAERFQDIYVQLVEADGVAK